MPRLLSICCLTALAAGAQDLAPLPTGGAELTAPEPGIAAGFLKPTKSIKPPLPASQPGMTAPAQPQVNAPTVARLRRLILLPGGLSPEAVREQIAAGGQSRQPMTWVGLGARAPVMAGLGRL
ncbi:MAG TPA: hypothetical protein DIT13_03490, partial [Verrucomicrobiales bacterium]|nr:hypothetical protein [Verrucomicrobiales bacterium]